MAWEEIVFVFAKLPEANRPKGEVIIKNSRGSEKVESKPKFRATYFF